MDFRIAELPETKLVGLHLQMSFAQNRTFELWRSFMPRRKEIVNAESPDLFSMQIFDSSTDFSKMELDATFEKWAAVPVSEFSRIPDGMETFTIPTGKYAVFIHKGSASDGPKTFGYIFGEWLPKSGFAIDARPHFEILGEKYKNDSVDSEEEIWIPIRVD
ncbi:MAG: AraC family transcriptional regulator [Flavobacterium sp.]|uniref:GyrI-like domain-containing protein n=1 Tax=Flavobacterium sp. TaxID=239 RepID=UPI0012275A89|nr:GyrI-like domain-containing protein [Flavobacterium sp.]RZJ68300.1 MAG: AraC family transcriptional regulator [Flavobacterium sp.]